MYLNSIIFGVKDAAERGCVGTRKTRPRGGMGPPAENFSRAGTLPDQRVLRAFLCDAGLSYRKLEPFVGCCYEAIRDRIHRRKHLFGPDCWDRRDVAVDETNSRSTARTLCPGGSRL